MHANLTVRAIGRRKRNRENTRSSCDENNRARRVQSDLTREATGHRLISPPVAYLIARTLDSITKKLAGPHIKSHALDCPADGTPTARPGDFGNTGDDDVYLGHQHPQHPRASCFGCCDRSFRADCSWCNAEFDNSRSRAVCATCNKHSNGSSSFRMRARHSGGHAYTSFLYFSDISIFPPANPRRRRWQVHGD